MKHRTAEEMGLMENQAFMHWAVAGVYTGRESETAALLTQRDRTVFYPTFTRWVRPRCRRAERKPVPVEVPAMPGYLFVQATTIGDPEELYALENFMYFLRRADGELATVMEDDISWLRKLEHEAPVVGPTFGLWDKVRIPEGPFGGMRGIVIGVEKGRAWVGGSDFKKPVSIPFLLLEHEDV